ncbi:CRTAC1 family protein [Crateriforma conspicua]|nr:CRTAC1 family protein [Crateriforma conspicua]
MKSSLRRMTGLWSALTCGLVLMGCQGDRDGTNDADSSGSQPAAHQGPSATDDASVSIADIRQLIASEQHDRAETLVTDLLIRRGDDPAVVEVSGDVAAGRNAHQDAIDRYQLAIDLTSRSGESPSAGLLDKLARQWMNAGRPFESLEILDRLVRQYPGRDQSRTDLAGLQLALGLENRAEPHLRYLIQRGVGAMGELIVLTDITRPQSDRAICEFALQQNPGDLRPRYSLVRHDVYEGRWAQSLDDLRSVWQQHPEFPEASAYYGRALIETTEPQSGDTSPIAQWEQSVTPETKRLSAYWMAVGRWAEKNRRIKASAVAFWNAARLNENDGEALGKLSGALAELGRSDQAAEVAARAADINAMRDAVEALFSWKKHSQRAAVMIARSMDRLGRAWEAASWARFATMMQQDPDPSAMEVFQSIRGAMTATTPWQDPTKRVARRIDLSSIAADLNDAPRDSTADVDVNTTGPPIRFVDQAADRGLDYVCDIGPAENGEAGLYIYQSGGGGAGVIDFDLDGCPDLMLTSCGGTPRKGDSTTNRLFRNVDGRFVDVTEASGTGDAFFSQGVAVGDIDSDGFPDLIVANFGRNQLLRNNGDGTFRDVTGQFGFGGNQWTTSLAIADIDGDALADVFEVNYIGGDDVIERKCMREGTDQHRSCAPLVFPGEADRFWRGTGTNRLADTTVTAMDVNQTGGGPGRGLGLVVGDLDQQGGMDVYVANDMSANHFWTTAQPPASPEGSPTVLREQGALAGVAFDGRSLSQASMGIAADDADNDGDIDLYVTHFTDDYNTFYSQVSGGLWADRTEGLGLVKPTMAMLGFGTQWIDADNDGWLELMVANGNVDDFSHSGHAYRMPMQLFRRDPSGGYRAESSDQLGPAMSAKRLGRALATLDVDDDGRTDAVLTNLFDPVTLLINRTGDPNPDSAIAFQLIGTSDHRDAVGGTVTVSTESSKWSRQRLAGNGFQSSNQARLHFGVGRGVTVVDAEVRWPGGQSVQATGLRTGHVYQWIQGSQRPILLRRLQAEPSKPSSPFVPRKG